MHHRLSAKKLIALLIPLACLSLIFGIGIGPVFVPPMTVLKMLLSKLPFVGGRIVPDWTDTQALVILSARLPRVLLGFVVGAALAYGGTSMQSLVKNELADPYILGIAYGAASFASIGIVMGFFANMGIYQNAVNGCIGALLTTGFIFMYSLQKGRMNISQLLLGGIAISMFFRAVIRILSLSYPQLMLHSNQSFWTQGGLAGARWAHLGWPLLIVLGCILFLNAQHRTLNAMLLGDETAMTLGINVPFMQKLMTTVTSILIGVTVSLSGGIGFIGLCAPHVARMLVGGDHRRVFPVSALLGGLFLLWCDALARMLFAPEELPVGIITAIVGGPFFIWLLKRRRY